MIYSDPCPISRLPTKGSKKETTLLLYNNPSSNPSYLPTQLPPSAPSCSLGTDLEPATRGEVRSRKLFSVWIPRYLPHLALFWGSLPSALSLSQTRHRLPQIPSPTCVTAFQKQKTYPGRFGGHSGAGLRFPTVGRATVFFFFKWKDRGQASPLQTPPGLPRRNLLPQIPPPPPRHLVARFSIALSLSSL